MENEIEPLWLQANLERTQFRDLPWFEKRDLINRYKGRPVFNACWKCGTVIRWKVARESKHDFRQLIDVYLH